MVKPWYGQNSLWQKITRSNGSGQTAPSRNRFRSKYGQTLSGQNTVKHQTLSGQTSNIICSKYGQTLSGQMRSNIICAKYGHFLRSNMISNAVKHYLVKIRSNIICSEYGQFLSGQKPKRPPASPKTFRGRRFGRSNRTWPNQHLVKTLGPARNGPPPPPKARERASSPGKQVKKGGAKQGAFASDAARSNIQLVKYDFDQIYNLVKYDL